MHVHAHKLNGDDPAHYRICAQGVFETRWLDLLSGIWAIAEQSCPCPHITTFVGCVHDQAALMGVLEQLYCMGLPILLVEHIAGEKMANRRKEQ